MLLLSPLLSSEGTHPAGMTTISCVCINNMPGERKPKGIPVAPLTIGVIVAFAALALIFKAVQCSRDNEKCQDKNTYFIAAIVCLVCDLAILVYICHKLKD